MSDPAIRLNVALKGRYRIERELGEGGWRSLDTPAFDRTGDPPNPLASRLRGGRGDRRLDSVGVWDLIVTLGLPGVLLKWIRCRLGWCRRRDFPRMLRA